VKILSSARTLGLTLAMVMLGGGVSEAAPVRERIGMSVASHEAPAILDLRYHALDRTRVRAAHLDFTAFQGVTLQAPLIAQIASTGGGALSFGSGMLVCAEVPRAWMYRCRGRVYDGPVILDLHRPTTAELRFMGLEIGGHFPVP
jgi:hypothetical protein